MSGVPVVPDTPRPPDWWTPEDFRERLVRAAETLEDLAQDALMSIETDRNFEHRRLRGKADGVRLALSYFDEWQNAAAVRGVSGWDPKDPQP